MKVQVAGLFVRPDGLAQFTSQGDRRSRATGGRGSTASQRTHRELTPRELRGKSPCHGAESVSRRLQGSGPATIGEAHCGAEVAVWRPSQQHSNAVGARSREWASTERGLFSPCLLIVVLFLVFRDKSACASGAGILLHASRSQFEILGFWTSHHRRGALQICASHILPSLSRHYYR